jgi:hypothetical protein
VILWHAPIVGDKSLRKFFPVFLLQKGLNELLLAALLVRRDFLEANWVPVVHRSKHSKLKKILIPFSQSFLHSKSNSVWLFFHFR